MGGRCFKNECIRLVYQQYYRWMFFLRILVNKVVGKGMKWILVPSPHDDKDDKDDDDNDDNDGDDD